MAERRVRDLSEEEKHAIKVLKGCVKSKRIVENFGVLPHVVRYLWSERSEKRVLTKKELDAAREREKIKYFQKRFGSEIEFGSVEHLQVWDTELPEVRVVTLATGENRFVMFDQNGNFHTGICLTTLRKKCETLIEALEVMKQDEY